jgi:hypothetical protein
MRLAPLLVAVAVAFTPSGVDDDEAALDGAKPKPLTLDSVTASTTLPAAAAKPTPMTTPTPAPKLVFTPMPTPVSTSGPPRVGERAAANALGPNPGDATGFHENGTAVERYEFHSELVHVDKDRPHAVKIYRTLQSDKTTRGLPRRARAPPVDGASPALRRPLHPSMAVHASQRMVVGRSDLSDAPGCVVGGVCGVCGA